MTKPAGESPERANPQLRPRYAGITTFFRRPLRETAAGINVAVVGVPFDGGVTNRPARDTGRGRSGSRRR